MAMPIGAANHIAAAVVRFVIFLSISLFKIIPLPRKRIPVTSYAPIPELELESTAADRYLKIMESPMTRRCVLISAGLLLDSLSAPIKNPIS
jgi:hypothetical protein